MAQGHCSRELGARQNLCQDPGAGWTSFSSLHGHQFSCSHRRRTLGMQYLSLSFMVLAFVFLPLDVAYLYILLAPVRRLLGSSHSYSLLCALNLLLISPVVPASFNYINTCCSQMKRQRKKRTQKMLSGNKQRPGSTAGFHLWALS